METLNGLGNSRPNLSVIIATCNRPTAVARLLRVLTPSGLAEHTWEIIVANNGGCEETDRLLARNDWNLPLVRISLPKAGKSRALNTALELARGELIVFTDDDVVPSPGWLVTLWLAFRRYPSAVLFTGPIIPLFPSETPSWLRDHPLAATLFARYEPTANSGYISPYQEPFGPNFAVKRSAIRHMQFREDLGPSDENGALSYDDSDFIAELRSRHSPFVPQGGFVFDHAASVSHIIRPEQVKLPWILERFFNNGRSLVALTGRLICAPFSPLGSKMPEHKTDPVNELLHRADINYYLGAFYELHRRGDRPRATDLRGHLVQMVALGELDQLSKSAVQLAMPLLE